MEILHKAKKKNWEELPKEDWWVEGFYFCMVHDDGSHVHHFIMPLGTDLSLGTPIEKIQVEVDPETVCPYIGKTDQNGRKIFLGDILRYQNEENPNDVCYERVAWNGLFLCLKTKERELVMSNWDCEHREVVGNIFDNPS